MGIDSDVRQAIATLRTDGAVEQPHESEFDVNRMLMLVWRAKWLLALFALAGLVISYAQLLRVTPLYSAQARVLWEINQNNVVDLDPVAGGLGSDYQSLGSQIEVISSGRLLERVVTEMDLASDPVFNYALQPPEGWTRWLSMSHNIHAARNFLFGGDEPAEKVQETPEQLTQRLVWALGGSVSAEWLDGTYVLIIRALTSDPQRSADVANAMAKYYILDQLETKFEATRQATDWLTDRVADLRIALQTAEQAVEDFSSGASLVSEEALAASGRQLKDLRERADALAVEQTDTKARLAAVETARAESKPIRRSGACPRSSAHDAQRRAGAPDGVEPSRTARSCPCPLRCRVGSRDHPHGFRRRAAQCPGNDRARYYRDA